jgi:glycosyltransferase involved in cell wall biosynthesis
LIRAARERGVSEDEAVTQEELRRIVKANLVGSWRKAMAGIDDDHEGPKSIMRRILILPPHNLWAAWTNPPDPSEPDGEKTFRLLAERGYHYGRLDPFGRPWNPFAKAHPIIRAIDPIRALRVLIFHRNTDVVLCCFESSALVIVLLRRLFLFRGKVAVLDVGVGGNSRLRDFILRLVLPRANALLVMGRSQVAGLLAMGARQGTIHIFRTGTSTDFFVDVEDQPDGYILAVGDDVSRDYMTLLKASVGLTRKMIIRSRLVAEDRAMCPNIKVVSSSLPTLSYKQLIAGAVLVVLPLHRSSHAGGVSTLLEAMSSGKAVIVSASPGLAEYIEDGTTCCVVPPGDPVALRNAIDDLLANTATRRRLGINARRFVVKNCSAETSAAQLAEVLGQLVRTASD